MKINRNDKTQKSLRISQTKDKASDKLVDPEFAPDSSATEILEDATTRFRTYNNTIISVRFSQQNFEKCLLTAMIILVSSLTIWYLFSQSFPYYFSIFFYITSSIDCVIFVLVFFCVLKLRRQEIFAEVSFSAFEVIDNIILINFILKVAGILAFSLELLESDYIFESFLIAKSILDIYFCFISLKMCILSSCFVSLNEALFGFWIWMKSTFCCVDHEEEPDYSETEYTKFDDLDS